jgi:hypothetical protein
MLALVASIHAFAGLQAKLASTEKEREGVDARDKREHDD